MSMETTYKYDERKKELHITRKHELSSPSDKELIVGYRTVTDTLSEEGMRNMMSELHAQKNSYGQQSKVMEEQLKGMKEVSVDQEFIDKYTGVQQMQQKAKLLDNVKNADEAIKELARQIGEVKNAVGDRIKW